MEGWEKFRESTSNPLCGLKEDFEEDASCTVLKDESSSPSECGRSGWHEQKHVAGAAWSMWTPTWFGAPCFGIKVQMGGGVERGIWSERWAGTDHQGPCKHAKELELEARGKGQPLQSFQDGQEHSQICILDASFRQPGVGLRPRDSR